MKLHVIPLLVFKEYRLRTSRRVTTPALARPERRRFASYAILFYWEEARRSRKQGKE
ncbi:hypothetical protein HXA34_01350 [Salipaludibacillus agaradhaerens]|uniref:hypothetical protein n=1 Tax=Salipaludibacillus agaradhaerens TaxID=76935 RepID=UPI002151E789|nr:hypothetical protein [Salipaludibacillus agaradhaerens]MCR6104932.1 hypothetical protein [Salipaludibacillus agaradhaerens]MCR6116979.1 hypothetical protein [Salipaludibacillus agaradhaerens]UJW56175.1 hypothetical protein HXZ66_01450 [Bacillus sp. A116_S68]